MFGKAGTSGEEAHSKDEHYTWGLEGACAWREQRLTQIAEDRADHYDCEQMATSSSVKEFKTRAIKGRSAVSAEMAGATPTPVHRGNPKQASSNVRVHVEDSCLYATMLRRVAKRLILGHTAVRRHGNAEAERKCFGDTSGPWCPRIMPQMEIGINEGQGHSRED